MAAGVVPMPSSRMPSGDYLVLGTSRECIVRRRHRPREVVMIGFGLDALVADGWDLYVDGEFHRWFETKREALQHCQERPDL